MLAKGHIMNIENIFGLKPYVILALVLAILTPLTSIAAAGRVEFAIGGVTATTKEGAARILNKGADINSGDTIKTTDGRAQVRFTDGGYISLQPNTEFIVENYAYDGKQDGSEIGFFRLVEGGLRAITGIVGRNNKPAYRVATPVATIGIRGSEFLTEFRERKLKLRVIDGSIYIENQYGNLILFKGQSAETEEDQAPGYSDEESGVLARGPQGGEPGNVYEQTQHERDLAHIFVVNEQYDGEGTSCALTNSCAGDSNIIAQYAAANAYGIYESSSSSLSGLADGYSGYAYGYLEAYFGDYSVYNNFDVAVNDGESFYYAEFEGSGSIGSTGSINLPNLSYAYGTSGFCSGSCTASGTGAFSGISAEKASIDYVINQVNPNIAPSSNLGLNIQYDAIIIAADAGEGEVLYTDPNYSLDR